MASAETKERLRKVVTGSPINDPRLAEVAYTFIDLCGGPKGFARTLFQEFTNSEPGGIARQRILDMMMRSLKFANEQDPKGSDASMLNDEDLTREIERTLAEIGNAP